MEIIIKCESMQELKSVTESLFVDLPEGSTKKQKKKPDEDTEPKERGKTTPFDKIEIAGLYNEGLKAPEIANIIGSSTNTVYNILNKLRKEGKIE